MYSIKDNTCHPLLQLKLDAARKDGFQLSSDDYLTTMFISMTTLFKLQVKAFWNWESLVLQSLTSGNISISGPSFDILDWTYYYWTLLYQIYILSTRVTYRGFPELATDFPCGYSCCGSTIYLLYGPRSFK